MKSLILAAFALLFCVGLASAELPPSAYTAMQKGATEVLEIKVHCARRGLWISPGEKVSAIVTKVVRSANGVKVGQMIEIRYRHRPLRGAAGPSPIPLLEKGDVVPAYLSLDGQHFRPAAGGYSFREVD